jgi:hypothetical protein
MRNFVMQFIEQEHPDVLEKVTTTSKDETISENSAKNNFLTYEALCVSRNWDIKDPENEAKIEQRIKLGWLKRGPSVSKSEAAVLDEHEFPRCSKFKYILTEVSTSSTNRTLNAMCVAKLWCVPLSFWGIAAGGDRELGLLSTCASPIAFCVQAYTDWSVEEPPPWHIDCIPIFLGPCQDIDPP